jgi:Holliday junction resolvase-like predicted endonuclease
MLPVEPKLTERQFQARVVTYARIMGWRCFHHFDSRRSEAGWPDLVLIRRPRVVFVEVKSARGSLTDAQRECLGLLRSCKQEVYVARPSDWPALELLLR